MKITRENINNVSGMPLDMADELVIGCETWCPKPEVTITTWPNGRGAICFGGDSIWGDWDGEILYTDDGAKYSEDGVDIDA